MSDTRINPFDSDNDDVETILEDLEKMNSNEMTELEHCLEERMSQERLRRFGCADSDDEEDEDPLFSDLALDYRPKGQAFEARNTANFKEMPSSPIRHRTKRAYHQDIRITVPALDREEEKIRAYDPESHCLLNKATRSLCSLYSMLDKIDAMEEELLPATRDVSRQTEEPLPEQEKENLKPEKQLKVADEAVEVERPSSRNNRRLRMILAPKPGQTLYKHDPVTMHQMYMEEWKRRPTPEEQKRLSLRWKIRDYMMSRKFVPKKQPTGNPIYHEKDWSPRPYLY